MLLRIVIFVKKLINFTEKFSHILVAFAIMGQRIEL